MRGNSSLATTPHPVLRTTLSPLPRGEGKGRAPPLFSLLPAKWGEGARRADEGSALLMFSYVRDCPQMS
jgi:hypothetical protein